MSVQVIDSGLAHNTGTATASTITLGEFHGLGPPQAGDLVVAQVMERSGTGVASHGSSDGYAQRGVKSDQGATVGSTRWTKVLTTGETTGTVHTFTFSASAANRSIAWIVLRSTRGPWTSGGQAYALLSAPWHSTTASTTVNWPGFTTDATEPVTLVGFANATSVNLAGGIPNPAGTTEVQETQSGSAAGSWRRTSVWYQHNVPVGAIATKTATLGTAAVNQGGMIAIAEPPQPVLTQTQERFRFYADDAGEAAATPLGALNANVSVAAGTNFRWRSRAKSAGGAPTQNATMRPYYSLNGGAWTQVGTNLTTTVVDSRPSPHLGADAATTDRLGGTGAFNPGSVDNTNAVGSGYRNAPALNDATEMEYCLQVNPAAVSPGDTVDLRLYEGTAPLTSYAVEARLTVLAATNTLPLPGGPGSDETPGVLLPSPGAASVGVPGAFTEETTGTLAAVAQARTLPLAGAITDELAGGVAAVALPATRPLTGLGTDETTGVLSAVPQVYYWLLAGLGTDETAPAGRVVAVPQAATRPLTGVPSDEGTGTLVAVPQARTQPLSGLSGEETTGTLTTTAGTSTVPLTGAGTDELPGTIVPTQIAANTILLSGAATDEAAGTLGAQAQGVAVSLTGAVTEEAPGALTAAPQARTVPLTGQGTDELPGTVTPTQVPPNTVALTGAATDEAAGALVPVAVPATLTLTGAATEELPGTLTATGEGPGVTTVALTGAGSDAIPGSVTPVPGPATVALVGAQTDELPGRPYEPETGTPPQPVILYGIVERPCAAVGVRDPPTVLLGVVDRPRARVGVVEDAGVTMGTRDTPGALLGVR